MSSGVADPAEVSALRAMAHPLRLRMLSLLTGTAMSAAEVARELALTHANASYHLRQLQAVGLLVVESEESVRGGKAKRYRYDLASKAGHGGDADSAVPYYQAIAGELVRRASGRQNGTTKATSSDAELWVPAEAWQRTVERVAEAIHDLHVAAVAPRTADALHVSVTTALFEMGADS
jgi:DNA-binding transcriptional ArsR family regulator